MKQSIFSATFEESQNLLNDVFMKPINQNDLKKINSSSTKKTQTKTRKNIAILFWNVFFILLPNLIIAYMSNNYFPFGIGLTILLLSLFMYIMSPIYLKETMLSLSCFVVGPLWVIIGIDIFVIPIAIKEKQLIIIIGIFLLTCAFLIIKQRVNSFEFLLFNSKESKFNYYFKKVFKLICIVAPFVCFFVAWILLFNKLLFHIEFKLNLNSIGIYLFFIIFNLAMIFVIFYIISVPLLFGYYLHKYPEEYRKSEKKTYQQWYGKLYLKFKELKDNETNE